MLKKLIYLVVTFFMLAATNLSAQVSEIKGRMVFVSDRGGHQNLWVMDFKTGDLTRITDFPDASGINGIAWPKWSPDGELIAFNGGRGREVEFCSGEIFTVHANPYDPEFKSIHQVTTYPQDLVEASIPAWDPSNPGVLFYIEYQWGGYGKAHRLDIELGEDILIPDAIGQRIEFFDISTDGQSLLFSRDYQFYGFQDLAGIMYSLFPFNDGNNKWIGRVNRVDDWILYHQLSGGALPAGIYKINPAGDPQSVVALTPDVGAEQNYWPAWTAGGNDGYILFQTNRFGNDEIVLMKADGNAYPGQLINLTDNPATDLAPDWTPHKAHRKVHIDIKPDEYPNYINPGTQGNIRVAIFSSPSFDATSINPYSVSLASAPVRLKGNGSPLTQKIDANGDGLVDLIVQIELASIALNPGDEIAVLEGMTNEGIPIMGTDSILIRN